MVSGPLCAWSSCDTSDARYKLVGVCVCVCDAVTEFERVLRWILSEGASVNFYMFHGGTNFGFLAGANDRLNPTNESYIIDYSPVVTSYGSSLIALCVINHLMTNFTVWR